MGRRKSDGHEIQYDHFLNVFLLFALNTLFFFHIGIFFVAVVQCLKMLVHSMAISPHGTSEK